MHSKKSPCVSCLDHRSFIMLHIFDKFCVFFCQLYVDLTYLIYILRRSVSDNFDLHKGLNIVLKTLNGYRM